MEDRPLDILNIFEAYLYYSLKKFYGRENTAKTRYEITQTLGRAVERFERLLGYDIQAVLDKDTGIINVRVNPSRFTATISGKVTL